MTKRDTTAARKGRQAAMAIAGTAVFWVLAVLIGEKEGFSMLTRLGLDLVALAGFVFAFWLIFQYWRARQDNQR